MRKCKNVSNGSGQCDSLGVLVGLKISSVNLVPLPATLAGPPAIGGLRIKPSRRETDTSSVWKCLICNKSFSKESNLMRHCKKCSVHVENPCVSVDIAVCGPSDVASLDYSNEASPSTTVTKKQRKGQGCSMCHKSFADRKEDRKSVV